MVNSKCKCGGDLVLVEKKVSITKEAAGEDKLDVRGRTVAVYELPPEKVWICRSCAAEQKHFEEKTENIL